MGAPRIEYDELEEGRVKAQVFGGNGEKQLGTEVYDSKSNADRGLAEIARTVLQLVADGKIDLTRAT